MLLLMLLAIIAALAAYSARGPRDNRPPNRPPGPPPPAVGSDCHPNALTPLFIPGIGIVGGAVSDCDEEPIAHYLQVAVEKETASGQWLPVPNVQALTDFTECSEVPSPGHPVGCDHIVACVDGHYRTVVTVLYQDARGVNHPPVRAPTTPDAHVTC